MLPVKSGLAAACGAALGLAVLIPAASLAATKAADTILTNGSVYTVNPAQPWAQAVAISNGRIVYVGSVAGAKSLQGKATRVIDLGGRFVMPGLVDEHVHPVMGGLKDLFQCNFAFTATPDDITKALTTCAAKAPEGAWIRGGQWGSSFFDKYKLESPKALLDRVTTTHPIALMDDSGHNSWVNSAGLKAAGISAATPDPEGGTIVRAANGEPNGVLLETAARVLDTVIPQWSAEQVVAAARYAAHSANVYGITAIKDAGAPFDQSAKAFDQLDRAGELTLNVAICARTPYGGRSTPLDYAEIERQRDQYQSPHVHTNFVKLFLDGVPTPARTAAMLDPYVADTEHGANFKGSMHIDAALLARDVTELDRRGFTIKMHAAGDGSVHAALDAIAAARKANGNSGQHHELAHAGFVSREDIPRFAKLDAIPDFSPILWYPSSIILAVQAAVGERAAHYWPTRTLLDNGALIAAGSDWPAAVPDENPWVGIEALVTRQDPRHETPGTLWKEEAVTLPEAVRIYTYNGARALRLERRAGTIEKGKSADIIVLDRNLFRVPIGEVGGTKVLMTLFEGRVVYEAPATDLSTPTPMPANGG